MSTGLWLVLGLWSLVAPFLVLLHLWNALHYRRVWPLWGMLPGQHYLDLDAVVVPLRSPTSCPDLLAIALQRPRFTMGNISWSAASVLCFGDHQESSAFCLGCLTLVLCRDLWTTRLWLGLDSSWAVGTPPKSQCLWCLYGSVPYCGLSGLFTPPSPAPVSSSSLWLVLGLAVTLEGLLGLGSCPFCSWVSRVTGHCSL